MSSKLHVNQKRLKIFNSDTQKSVTFEKCTLTYQPTMQNKKNSSKPTWVPFNTWEAQQKALVKAKLEARKKQKEEEEKAKREAMFKPYNWGTHSGK